MNNGKQETEITEKYIYNKTPSISPLFQRKKNIKELKLICQDVAVIVPMAGTFNIFEEISFPEFLKKGCFQNQNWQAILQGKCSNHRHEVIQLVHKDMQPQTITFSTLTHF